MTIYGSNSGVREIALTFDDGPNPRTTPRLLDILAKHGIKAIFFVIGQQLTNESGKSIIKRASSEGHIIGNHTYSHPNLRTLKTEEIRVEILKTHNLIIDTVGSCNLFRPPYGSTNSIVENIIRENGYHQLLWSVDTMDWKYKSNAEWVEFGMKQIKAREDSIVLMHDIHSTTVDNVENLILQIKKIKDNNFVLYT